MNHERMIVSMDRLRQATIRVSFAMLDYRLANTPLEDRPERSWEVEREEFIRRLISGQDPEA